MVTVGTSGELVGDGYECPAGGLSSVTTTVRQVATLVLALVSSLQMKKSSRAVAACRLHTNGFEADSGRVGLVHRRP